MDIEKLESLAKLKAEGAITEEEFQEQKNMLMTKKESSPVKDTKLGMDDSTFNVVLHLSQFCSMLIPLLGIAAPIILWVMNKDTDPVVDEHGKNILNWTISLYIYLFVCSLLMFVLIGLVLIWIPLVMSFIFPIIGALKAKDGIAWKYPFSIPFLK